MKVKRKKVSQFRDFFKQCECEESNLILNFAAIFLRKEDKKFFVLKLEQETLGVA